MRFEIAVTGTERLRAAFTKLGNDAPAAAGEALYKFGAYVMHDSRQNYVPVDTGRLRGSGHVEQPVRRGTAVSVVFGYGGAAAPYALAVHENPRSGKTRGISPSGYPYRHWARVGQWKYLEIPLQRHARRLPAILAQSLSKMVRTQSRSRGGFRFR